MGRKKSLRNVGKFFLRTDREPNRLGEYPIYIQYTLDGKIAKGETGVWVKEKDWDANRQRVRSTHRMAARLNQVLDEKKLYIDTEVLLYLGSSAHRITIDVLRRIVQGMPLEEGKVDADFIQYMRDNQRRRYEVGKISVSTHENGDNTVGRFREFLRYKLQRDTISCSEVSVQLISDYIVWRLKERGNKPATVNKALTPIMRASKSAAIDELMSSKVAEAIGELYLSERRSLDSSDDEDNHSDHYLTGDDNASEKETDDGDSSFPTFTDGTLDITGIVTAILFPETGPPLSSGGGGGSNDDDDDKKKKKRNGMKGGHKI